MFYASMLRHEFIYYHREILPKVNEFKNKVEGEEDRTKEAPEWTMTEDQKALHRVKMAEYEQRMLRERVNLMTKAWIIFFCKVALCVWIY